jgi:hypothetical protein
MTVQFLIAVISLAVIVLLAAGLIEDRRDARS